MIFYFFFILFFHIPIFPAVAGDSEESGKINIVEFNNNFFTIMVLERVIQ